MRPPLILLLLLASPAAAAPTPLVQAEPYFMAARYSEAFALVRNYDPPQHSLRLDFVFGVSACLSGEDTRAWGLMMLNTITTTYTLTTRQAAKVARFIAQCQPAEAVVNAPATGIIPASASGVSTSVSSYSTYSLTKDITGLGPVKAKQLEHDFIILNADQPAKATPNVKEIMTINKATLARHRPSEMTLIKSTHP